MIRALLLVVFLAGAVPAEAAECAVPAALAPGKLALPAARAAIARTGRLMVMTIGGAATAGITAGDAMTSYPAQLRAALATALPGVVVEMVNRAAPGRGTAHATLNLRNWLAETEPALVIWGTGAREMAHSADIDSFAASLQAGIDAVRLARADMILLDMQYAPSIARVTNAEPYRRVLQGAAATNDIWLMPRYDLMLAWNDAGILDLDAQSTAARQNVAHRLFECLAGALASPILLGLR